MLSTQDLDRFSSSSMFKGLCRSPFANASEGALHNGQICGLRKGRRSRLPACRQIPDIRWHANRHQSGVWSHGWVRSRNCLTARGYHAQQDQQNQRTTRRRYDKPIDQDCERPWDSGKLHWYWGSSLYGAYISESKFSVWLHSQVTYHPLLFYPSNLCIQVKRYFRRWSGLASPKTCC